MDSGFRDFIWFPGGGLAETKNFAEGYDAIFSGKPAAKKKAGKPSKNAAQKAKASKPVKKAKKKK